MMNIWRIKKLKKKGRTQIPNQEIWKNEDMENESRWANKKECIDKSEMRKLAKTITKA